MSFRSQTSRKGASKHINKSTREKKSKNKNRKVESKYFQEETEVSIKEMAEKTIISFNRLGSQTFALSPFSQYFDDWLLNIRQVISEFASNPVAEVDEQFQKEASQILLNAEEALSENKLLESNLTSEAKDLDDLNRKMADEEKKYCEQTRNLNNKRNTELQRLNVKIRQLEEELSSQQDIKMSFFKFKEKRIAAEKLAQTTQDLNDARKELESSVQNFTAEQEKLRLTYEKYKQDFHEKSGVLHKKLEKLEIDTSLSTRQTSCNALSEIIKNFLNRQLA